MIKFDVIKKYNDGELPWIKELVLEDDYVIFRLQGDIDVSIIPNFPEGTQHDKNISKKHFIIDFKDVAHVDSSTIASLVRIFSQLKVVKKKLVVINVTAFLKNYIEIFKVALVVKICKSEEQALKIFLKSK